MEDSGFSEAFADYCFGFDAAGQGNCLRSFLCHGEGSGTGECLPESALRHEDCFQDAVSSEGVFSGLFGGVGLVKGKPWTVEEERLLREMVQQKKSLAVMASTLGKSVESVRTKIRRLGLRVVVARQIQGATTSSSGGSGELPTIEEALRSLNEALVGLKTAGLEQSETLRLRSIIQGIKTYKELLADYLDFRGLESRLFELEAKYAELSRKGKAQGV